MARAAQRALFYMHAHAHGDGPGTYDAIYLDNDGGVNADDDDDGHDLFQWW